MHLELPLGIGEQNDAGRNGSRNIAVNTNCVPKIIRLITKRVIAERFSCPFEIISDAQRAVSGLGQIEKTLIDPVDLFRGGIEFEAIAKHVKPIEKSDSFGSLLGVVSNARAIGVGTDDRERLIIVWRQIHKQLLDLSHLP